MSLACRRVRLLACAIALLSTLLAAPVQADGPATAPPSPRIAFADARSIVKAAGLDPDKNPADKARLRAAVRQVAERRGADIVVGDAWHAKPAFDISSDVARALAGTAGDAATGRLPEAKAVGYVNLERALTDTRLSREARDALAAEFSERDKAAQSTPGAAGEALRDAVRRDLGERRKQKIQETVDESRKRLKAMFDATGMDILLSDAVYVGRRVDVSKAGLAAIDLAAPGNAGHPAVTDLRLATVESERVLNESAPAKRFQQREAELQASSHPDAVAAAKRRELDTEELINQSNRVLQELFAAGKYDIFLQDPLFVSKEFDITEQVLQKMR